MIKRHTSFTYLNITQFLGALNDNVFKLLSVYFLIYHQGIGQSDQILAITGAIFVLPFLLFSAGSGALADRHSKRNIIVLCKLLEILAMAMGVIVFAYELHYGTYAVLFLMASQSALFGPSKYSIVPELVQSENINKANGLLTSFTYFAIIIGTFFGTFITHITDRNFVLGALFCTGIAILGFITSFSIEYTQPAGSKKKLNPLFFREIYRTLRRVRREPTLLVAVFGSAYFLFCGAYVQLNIIPYAIQTLGLSEIHGGYLFLLTAMGIGLGSITIGKASGECVELGVVPIAGFLLSICCFLLDYLSGSLSTVIPLVILTGLFGGIYLIPIDTFIQVASPSKIRGQVIAASNFLAFIGVLGASGMIMLIRVLGLEADKGFTVVAFLTAIFLIFVTIRLRDYTVRFLGMLASRILFEMDVTGKELVPLYRPSILICYHHRWSDAVMILGAQRRRLHFFIECSKGTTFLQRLLRRILKITPSPSLTPPNIHPKSIGSMRHAIRRGQSVCIFLEGHHDSEPPLDKLAQEYRALINDGKTPIIPVRIVKNPKNYPKDGIIYQFLRLIRVPASVDFIAEEEVELATDER